MCKFWIDHDFFLAYPEQLLIEIRYERWTLYLFSQKLSSSEESGFCVAVGSDTSNDSVA